MTALHRAHARCACAAAPRPFAFATTSRQYERDRPFLPTHIALDVALDFDAKAIDATAIISLTRVDPTASEVALDAVAFDIAWVRVDAGEGFRPAPYRYDGDRLVVDLPPAATPKVEVRYRAVPRRGLYFLAPDEHVRDRPRQVWTQFQDEDARHVVPCLDKPHVKQTTEVRVRVPAGWFALSNGTLVGHEEGDGHATYHWKMRRPHATYLMTLVAGEFSTLDDGEVGGVPVTYYVPKGREADGRASFGDTPAMLEHFARLTGVDFPWEKYAQVVVSDFIFGGMENTSATTMYEHVLLDDKARLDLSSNDLIAHELAHQWFGDYVTCRDWSHGWLNEGFATFFEHVERERRLGPDEYEYGVKQDQDAYLAEATGRYRRPLVCQDYEAPIDLFDRHLYEKGGVVLHMLRRELGDDVFWKGVGHYLKRHAFGVVETRDLCRALEEVSGRGLDRFFEQWVFKAGHPELAVRVEHEKGLLVVTVKQGQKVGGDVPLFALDLELEVGTPGGVKREVVRVRRADESFALPSLARPSFVVVDPSHRVLGEVNVELPPDMLRRQLAEAPSARGRWLAARSLARRDDPKSHQALAAALGNDAEFWGVRAEAAVALGSLRTDEAFATLSNATSVAHPKVRRAVADALGNFRRADAVHALRALALRDESYAVEAAAARALGATRQGAAFDTLVELLDRDSWAEVVRAGAIDGLASLRDERALPHLVARTRYGVPTRARQAAIRSLGRAPADRKTRELLEDLLEDTDPHLRIDVAVALGEIGDPKSRGPLARALERDLDGRVRRRLREILRDLAGAGRDEQQRVGEDIDRLRAELAELRGRLAKVEAKGEPAAPPSPANDQPTSS